MQYYSSFYRKLLGMDSPSGRPLKAKRKAKKRAAVKKRIKSAPKIPKGYGLIITKKVKQAKKQASKKTPLRKARVTYSKRRLGQIAMRPQDIYEKQMARRIQQQSGMTHIQVMHLIRRSRESDIDIEHKIDWRLSRDKAEQYEMASEALEKEINPMKKTIRDLSSESGMYGF